MTTPLQELSEQINALPKPDNGNSRLVLMHIKTLVAQALDKERETASRIIDDSLFALLGTIQMGWIETANEKPFENQTVFFIFNGLVSMGIYNDKEDHFSALNGNNYRPEDVPFWMPRYIPKPPTTTV